MSFWSSSSVTGTTSYFPGDWVYVRSSDIDNYYPDERRINFQCSLVEFDQLQDAFNKAVVDKNFIMVDKYDKRITPISLEYKIIDKYSLIMDVTLKYRFYKELKGISISWSGGEFT